MRYGEGLDGEASHRERLVNLDITARGTDGVLHEATMRDAVMHQLRSIDREVINSPDDADCTDMVGVVVRDDDAVDRTAIQRYAFALKGLGNGTDGDSRIDEEAPRFVSEVVAVPTAPTGETHKSYHSWNCGVGRCASIGGRWRSRERTPPFLGLSSSLHAGGWTSSGSLPPRRILDQRGTSASSVPPLS